MYLTKFFELNSFDLIKALSLYDNSAICTPITEDSDGKKYIFVELPGVNKEDIKITINDHILDIIAERKEKSLYKQYKNQWSLPQNVDRSKITAKLEHGLLRITLPVLQEENDIVIKVT